MLGAKTTDGSGNYCFDVTCCCTGNSHYRWTCCHGKYTLIRADLKQAIIRSIIDGIQRNGDRIFNTSQNTEGCFVPVDTGFLKRSGVKDDMAGGMRIVYRAPYSIAVEYGSEAQPYVGKQTIHVRSHKRKGYTRKDGAYVAPAVVKPHDKVYEDGKLIGFRPKLGKFEHGNLIFRVMKGHSTRKGQFFLTRAVRQELPNLPEDIEFYLKKLR